MELSNPKSLIGQTVYVNGKLVKVTDASTSDFTGNGHFYGTTETGSICGGPIRHIGKKLYPHPLLNVYSDKPFIN